MTSDPLFHTLAPRDLLRWYLESGVDEAIGENPLDRTARPPPPQARPPAAAAPVRHAPVVENPAMPAAEDSRATATHLAMACHSLEALRAALDSYEGCALRHTCQRTVFADGNAEAAVMVIGEAPGADEDRLGLPFVGASGRLLDRMLGSIGLDRTTTYITNVVPWRPPGNRKPEPAEVELCLPFLERQIELVDPQVMLLLGGAAAAALLARTDAISRLRGRWWDYASSGLSRPVPVMPTYHPAYLLRTPIHKREAWRDFLAVRKRLDGLS